MASIQPQVPFSEKGTEDHLGHPGSSIPETPGSEDDQKKLQLGEEGLEGEEETPAIVIPLKYRIIAIVLIILFGTGNTYAGFVLGPLKTRLVRELKITNAQFSIVSSASSLINTLLPIIGGSIIDRYGGSRIALGSAVLCVAGTVLSACSSIDNRYTLLVGGEIILGLGSAIQDICQYKLYPHWFAGSHMGLIFGVNVAWSRIIQLVARLTAVPMADIGPGRYWGWALWIPCITTFASGFCVYAYYFFENRILPAQYRPPKPEVRNDQTLLNDWKDTVKSIVLLPKFYWIMNVTQMLQGGATRVWLRNVADIQVKSRGTSEQAAGYNAALQTVIPIILTPVTGLFFDKIGWRMVFVTTTSLIWLLVWGLAGFTKINFLAPVLVSSFAYVTNLIPFMATVPILLPSNELMGTAFGVWQSFQNAGTLIMDVASGAIQDKTPGHQYDRVFIVIMVFKAYDAFLGPFYDWLDGKWLGHQLRMPERKRRDKLVQLEIRGKTYEGHERSKFWTWTGCSVLSAMVVTGWALYIIYSMPR
ncbi:hypothetical protein CspHIS471_0503040 [Cutaneotrichosporon sp. HIS471]|nr:hypothetical protein CspHIS471_0503040 [Cutaneotrichosporon sp. HIS471]